MSVDFADKAVENLYFLLPAAVLALDRFMHKDFFNQGIQKFGGQLRGVDVLFHQFYPLFSVNFCHPFKESNLADLDKPAPAERRKAGGVYQLIGAHS